MERVDRVQTDPRLCKFVVQREAKNRVLDVIAIGVADEPAPVTMTAMPTTSVMSFQASAAVQPSPASRG